MAFFEKLAQFPNPETLGYGGVFEQLIQIHIVFGLISLFTGVAILFLKKGTLNHKKIGRIFVAVMLGSFLLGVPLGSIGQLAAGEPANFMTVIGAFFVGSVTYSGFRLVRAGTEATAWHDKAALYLLCLAGLGYLYITALMVAGTNLFGLVALTLAGEQFTLLDNRFHVVGQEVALIGTSNEFIFGVIATENFVTPLFLASISGWFAYQDWRRIKGTKRYARPIILEQHYTRLLLIFSVAISAVLLNVEWLSFWLCWALPPACTLMIVFSYGAPGRRRVQALRSGTFFTKAHAFAGGVPISSVRPKPEGEKAAGLLK